MNGKAKAETGAIDGAVQQTGTVHTTSLSGKHKTGNERGRRERWWDRRGGLEALRRQDEGVGGSGEEQSVPRGGGESRRQSRRRPRVRAGAEALRRRLTPGERGPRPGSLRQEAQRVAAVEGRRGKRKRRRETMPWPRMRLAGRAAQARGGARAKGKREDKKEGEEGEEGGGRGEVRRGEKIKPRERKRMPKAGSAGR